MVAIWVPLSCSFSACQSLEQAYPHNSSDERAFLIGCKSHSCFCKPVISLVFVCDWFESRRVGLGHPSTFVIVWLSSSHWVSRDICVGKVSWFDFDCIIFYQIFVGGIKRGHMQLYTLWTSWGSHWLNKLSQLKVNTVTHPCLENIF